MPTNDEHQALIEAVELAEFQLLEEVRNQVEFAQEYNETYVLKALKTRDWAMSRLHEFERTVFDH